MSAKQRTDTMSKLTVRAQNNLLSVSKVEIRKEYLDSLGGASAVKKSEKPSEEKLKKSPERPKDNKNKNTLTEKQTEQPMLNIKRGPGRPKGSKNKSKGQP